MILAMLVMASDIFAQQQEVEFDVYTTSAQKASQYLLEMMLHLEIVPRYNVKS
jgi:hypothetical protein